MSEKWIDSGPESGIVTPSDVVTPVSGRRVGVLQEGATHFKEADPVPSEAVQGNIAVFGADGKLDDSERQPSDFGLKPGIEASVRALESGVPWE